MSDRRVQVWTAQRLPGFVACSRWLRGRRRRCSSSSATELNLLSTSWPEIGSWIRWNADGDVASLFAGSRCSWVPPRCRLTRLGRSRVGSSCRKHSQLFHFRRNRRPPSPAHTPHPSSSRPRRLNHNTSPICTQMPSLLECSTPSS